MSTDILQSKLDLQRLQAAIEIHLENIEKVIPDHILTLVANHKSRTDCGADILLTMSSRKRILQAVDKFLPEEKPAAGVVAAARARLMALPAWYEQFCPGPHPYARADGRKQDSAEIMAAVSADIRAVCGALGGVEKKESGVRSQEAGK